MTTDWTRQAQAGVDSWLEAQSAWWDTVMAAAPAEARADVEAMLAKWTDTQREMWQGWLAVAGGGQPGGAEDFQQAGREMAESLQQAAEALVRSQGEWAKAWAAAQEKSEKSG